MSILADPDAAAAVRGAGVNFTGNRLAEYLEFPGTAGADELMFDPVGARPLGFTFSGSCFHIFTPSFFLPKRKKPGSKARLFSCRIL
jgi:hypothetical protein